MAQVLRLLPVGLALLLCACCRSEPGLVEWLAAQQAPTAEAALRMAAGGRLRLQVRWRRVGDTAWAGRTGPWRPAPGGLTADGVGDGLFAASLRGEALDGGVQLRLRLTALRATTSATELLVCSPFDPAAWQRQFYPHLPYLALPPDKPLQLRFAADAADATSFAEVPEVAFYPCGVLESPRRFVLWGCRDVGRYVVLSPNRIPRSIPALALQPRQLAARQHVDLELLARVFDKPRCRYRDVLGWYLRHTVSSDPLVRDLFPWDGRRRARPLPAGNLGHGLGRLSDRATAEEKLLGEFARRRLGSTWFQGWGPWDESYPTTGSWYTEYWSKLSAEEVRAEVAWERDHGLFPLLYCRQFLTEQGVHDDRPPLREWLGRDEAGRRMAWMDNAVPTAAAAELGFGSLQQTCADFGSDGYRAWYEGRVKACLEYYRPGGIAWDMGWGAGPTWGYSRSDARVMNGDGMLRSQANLWAWLHAHHPEMRVIANEAFGTPSQLFADGILLEGGFASGKSELDYEAAKTLGTTIISFEYPWLYSQRLRGLPTSAARYVQLRYRAVGLNTRSDRYVVYPSQEVVGKEGPAICCSHLVADGDWHTATFDMGKLPAVEEIRGLAFGMDAAAPEAHLYVAKLWFSETPEGGPVPSQAGCFPGEIGGSDAAAFEPRPGWLGNPAADCGVRREGEALDFYVRGAGRGMSWSFYAAGHDLAQEYLRVLSLGACLGAGLRSGWETLNAFSAEAMALPPLTGSHEVEVSPETPGLNAAAWTGGGRLLVAVHNATDRSRTATVRVTGGAAGKVGAAASYAQLLDTGAAPLGAAPVKVRPTAGAIRLTIPLAPGQALLWGSWDWSRGGS